MAGFYEFQPVLENLFQTKYLARMLEEGLDSQLAYRRQATESTIQGHIGGSVTVPRVGRKKPVTRPLNTQTLTNNLDNGMVPSLPANETYEFILSEWGDTEDVDLIGNTAQNADYVTAATRTNGVQAAQSMERLAKIELFGCYDVGNSWVRGDLGGNSLTQIHVDDIRGFMVNWVNGVPEPVSNLNPLPCVEVKTGPSGHNQRFNVVAVAPDSPNQSLYPASDYDEFGNPISDGVSGILQVTGLVSVPASGDAIVSSLAQKVYRPNNKPSYNTLTSGDLPTLALLNAARARLQANAVPTFPDGTYHFLHDPIVMQQLLLDQQFLTAYASRYKSEEYQDGQIFELFGITFIPTTEAYVQSANPSLGVKVPVRRSILMGGQALLQGNFEGTEMYLNEEGLNPIGGVMMVNNVAQIVRPPIDRMLRVISLTWTWVGDFVCPTDITATPAQIPTASNAAYKRCVVLETAG